MNTTRSFRLSNSALTSLHKIDSNRSRVLTTVLKAVYDNPQIIIDELQHRLNGDGLVVDSDQTRVTVYMPIFVAGGFDDLVAKMRLTVEDLCRIAVEAYLRQHGKSQKASHEPARPVQHAPEG